MDFTLTKYRELLAVLDGYGEIQLRHDVDRKPKNSLATAKIEQELGWHATYYFRAVPESFDEAIIREIASMGHTIGYHYESLSVCHGDVEAAYKDFCLNLDRFRTLAPITTISMHGSPTSKWNNRDLWKYYDYHQLGIDQEPYLDIDFSKVFYLTDTGRRWDGYRVSVRDKIPGFQEQWIKAGWAYHSTDDIVEAVRDGLFPQKTLINTHPQRWADNPWQWFAELMSQSIKNVVKRAIVRKKV